MRVGHVTTGSPSVVVDARALQSADSADRGIGRYTLDCFEAVEHLAPHLVTWYVVDPRMPVHRNLRSLLPTGKVIRSDDERLEDSHPRILHVASPFEQVGSTDLVPEWARSTSRVVATVFDVIPALFPEIYLRSDAVRAAYESRLAWLRSADRLVAISQSAASDTERVLGLPQGSVTPIYGGVGSRFRPATCEDRHRALRRELPTLVDREFLLAPLGIEPRKNVDRLVAAYAELPADLQRAHPLVVQCAASGEQAAHYQALGESCGMVGRLVFTGFVADDTLVDLYRCAHLVVFPSLYEGLGLPVLEARRCGAPVVCGDNSSLAEIVTDPIARFDATEVSEIAGAVRRVLEDDGLRLALTEAPVGAEYEWSSVAGRLTAVYGELLELPERIVVPRSRPRLAVASPAPPSWVGPAVYLGNLLPFLAELCDVTLFAAVEPGDVEVPEGVSVERLSSMGLVEAAEGAFDEVLYFLGNSGHHLFEEHFLRLRPGAVFLHDARLTGLYSETQRLMPPLLAEFGGFPGLIERMYPGRYPPGLGGGGAVAVEDQDRLGLLMAADVARLATRMLVHAEHAADLIELDTGRRPEVVFPHPCEAVGIRRRPEPGLVGSFGIVSPVKGSDTLVEALVHGTCWRLALVGEVDEGQRAAFTDTARAGGCADRLEMSGAVDRFDYLDRLSRVSVAVQLRTLSNGESSGSLAECLAAGVPTVVSDIGTFSELPDDVVVKVPSDIPAAALAATIDELLADPGRLGRLSDAGRRYAAENSYEAAARTLVCTLFPERYQHEGGQP